MAGKNKQKQVLFSSLLALFFLGGQILAQVTIKKDVPPPLELNIEHCASATINTPQAMAVYMVGTATEAKEGLIAKVTTEKFEINPGVNHYSAVHLPPIAKTWIAPKYDYLIKRTGKFPEGYYTILIQLFTAAGQLLDDDKINHQVKYPQIRLLSPKDGAKITGPFPVFQWMSRRATLNFLFVLAIYKIMHNQAAKDAVHSIPYFEQKGIKTIFFPYPVSAKALEPGEYCWQVKALINGYPIVTSEIWNFVKEMKETAGECGKKIKPCPICGSNWPVINCTRRRDHEPPCMSTSIPPHDCKKKVKCSKCGKTADCGLQCPHANCKPKENHDCSGLTTCKKCGASGLPCGLKCHPGTACWPRLFPRHDCRKEDVTCNKCGADGLTCTGKCGRPCKPADHTCGKEEECPNCERSYRCTETCPHDLPHTLPDHRCGEYGQCPTCKAEGEASVGNCFLSCGHEGNHDFRCSEHR